MDLPEAKLFACINVRLIDVLSCKGLAGHCFQCLSQPRTLAVHYMATSPAFELLSTRKVQLEAELEKYEKTVRFAVQW